MYKLAGVTTGPIETNCYTVINEDTAEAILVDATGRAEVILRAANEAGAKVKALLLTHGHFDHVDAVDEVRKLCPDIEVIIGEKDVPVLENPSLNLSLSIMGEAFSTKADRTVKDGEEIELIGLKIRCIEVPGHTVGGMCYYTEVSSGEESSGIIPIVFDGDTLFHESIGRSDLPTGDGEALIKNIKEKLFTLPEETHVCPGHNSDTTIGYEKQTNIYFC